MHSPGRPPPLRWLRSYGARVSGDSGGGGGSSSSSSSSSHVEMPVEIAGNEGRRCMCAWDSTMRSNIML